MRQLMIVGLMMIIYLLLLVVVKPYKSFEAWLLALVEQTALVVFMTVCFIVKAEQLSRQVPDTWMTPEVSMPLLDPPHLPPSLPPLSPSKQ